MHDLFRRLAQEASRVLGSAWAFITAIVLVLVWAATGPSFHYSDTWQMVINTGTTIVTFLMIFLIQNSQNRDAKATLLKLDELIRAQTGARNQLINLEGLSESEIARVEAEFRRVRNAPDPPAPGSPPVSSLVGPQATAKSVSKDPASSRERAARSRAGPAN